MSNGSERLTAAKRRALEDELGYIERSLSYTFGRAGVEGTDPSYAVREPTARAREIRELLRNKELKSHVLSRTGENSKITIQIENREFEMITHALYVYDDLFPLDHRKMSKIAKKEQDEVRALWKKLIDLRDKQQNT
jgi:hypothetical protein